MSVPPASAAPSPPKEDPETLALRGRPRGAVRFRRGLIVGAAGAVAAGVIALSWAALDPPSLRKAIGASASDELGTNAPPDALAAAPRDYGEVPRLGPPLPGDLGRPILEHQRGLDAFPRAPVPGADPRDQARIAADAERQRAMEERAAARSSPVMAQLTGPPERRSEEIVGQPGADPRPAADAVSSAGQQRKIEFARTEEGTLDEHQLQPPRSPWTLTAGTIIPASLVTGLNSDLPGMVIAQVTENVRDSATGRTTLVPQGARLLGKYDSMISYGQRRALVVWSRIMFPDGSSIDLDNMPASDVAGYAGVKDRVDSHGWQLLKGIAMSTLLGVGTQLSLGSSESALVRAVRESAQQDAAHAGDAITSRNLDVQPTLTVRPGWPIRALLSKDLVLQPWRG